MGTPHEWAIRLTVGVAAGLFFGAIGPFGTYALPLPMRLAGWTAEIVLGVALFSLAVRGARLAAPRAGLPLWFATGGAVTVACAPTAVISGLVFNPRHWRAGGWAAVLEFYGDTLLVAAPLTLAYLLLAERTRQETACVAPEPVAETPYEEGSTSETQPIAPSPADTSGTTSLLDRLPPRLGRDLVALQMEDHYVRAHTPLGSDLLLMPLGQAVEALAQVEGVRVHRSWWVARTAVEGEAWEGRNLRLRLRGGLEAPVARASVAVLRAAGWLRPD